jgi:hypothetical protein
VLLRAGETVRRVEEWAEKAAEVLVETEIEVEMV